MACSSWFEISRAKRQMYTKHLDMYFVNKNYNYISFISPNFMSIFMRNIQTGSV